MELVFVELPKFTIEQAAQAGKESDFTAWFRYLTETGEQESAPEELAERGRSLRRPWNWLKQQPIIETSLEAYDRYWDVIRTERTLMAGRFDEGIEKGIEKGMEMGIEKGWKWELRRGWKWELRRGMEMALKKMMDRGFSEEEARQLLGFP